MRHRLFTPFIDAFSRCVLFLIVLCLTARLSLHAQNPAFAEMPDKNLRYVTAINIDMPVHTSFDIAVIETNAPSYMASSDKRHRVFRLNTLIALEEERLKPTPDLRTYWYEFVEAIAPMLNEQEMDAIAQDWWSASGYRAVKQDEGEALKSASFSEVRAHLQIFRTGSEAQILAAQQWLMRAQMAGTWDSFSIPPQARGMSPLAHLLARDIADEAQIYTGPEATKLRNQLKSLLAGKFSIQGEDGITRPLSILDVDALADALSSEDSSRKTDASEKLEDWLMQAIDADLNQYAKASTRRMAR